MNKYIATKCDWFGGKEYAGQSMLCEAESIADACRKFGAAEVCRVGEKFEQPYRGTLYIVHQTDENGLYNYATEVAIRVEAAK